MESRLSLIESWLKEVPDSDVEVIFVVDNCQDKTMINLKNIKIENRYEFIKLHEGIFGGPGGARNEGIRSSEGKWITFWDSDDLPDVKNFMNMLRNAEKRNKAIALGSWIACSVNSNDASKFNTGKIHNPGFVDTILNPGIWRWAFQKKEISNCWFPEIFMGEDQVFLANLNIKWHKVFKYSEVVYSYLKGYSGQLTLNKTAITDREKMNLHFKKFSVIKKKRSFFSSCIVLKTITVQKLKKAIHAS